MSFDWQTEEDSDWDEDAWQEKPETAVSSKPPWRTILLVVLLLALAGGVIYQQIIRRLDNATSSVELDIFAAHNLMGRAAANQDVDLGKTVLSGRDMGWSLIQSDLIAAGFLYEHPGLRLVLPEDTTAYAPLSREDERFIDLTLEPDLNGAELLYARDFQALTDDGVETVTLQQTAVYRRGETRWLLSPPLEAFWGDWQTLELDGISFVYPLRDEALLLQLAPDLQTLLDETCQTLPELSCSTQNPVQIRFDTNPESLLETADPANLYDANLRLNLPTPTLVGLPVDNDGYEALRNAYGANMVSALVGQTVGYSCCRHAPMFQAVLTYQLSELGLTEWPVTQEIQAALANGGVHVEMLFPYWSSEDFFMLNDENSWQLFGFVDFLMKQHTPQETPLAILGQMINSNAYQSWLVSLSEETFGAPFGSVDTISRDWWFYALTQSETTAVSSQPISLPAQDLQVGCLGGSRFNDVDFGQTSLYRHVLGNNSWIEELDHPGLAFFNPLPQDNGVVLQLIEEAEDQVWQTVLWRNGTGTVMMDPDDAYSISLGQVDPNGRFLLYYTGQQIDEGVPESRLIDMNDCLADNCSSTMLELMPYWSPDSQQTLLTDLIFFEGGHYYLDGRIFMIDPQGQSEEDIIRLSNATGSIEEAIDVGTGISPFWITSELFGFIQSTPVTDIDALTPQAVVVMSAADLEARTIIQTADLQGYLPENNRRKLVLMHYVIPHPTDPDRLLLMASTQNNSGYLFELNHRTQAIKLLFTLDLSRGDHTIGFSPDGRFIAATGSWQQENIPRGQSLPLGALHLYDFETGELQTIITNNDGFLPSFTFDWSADGNWLAFVRYRNAIGLIAPAYGYQQTIIHDVGNCSSLAWVNPLPPE